MSKPSLLFFGAGRFSRISFESLLTASNGHWSRIGVVVPPGPSELAKFALGHDLDLITAPPRSLKGWTLKEEPWDFGAVCSFSYFISAPIIDSFRRGMLNAHPSLLPAYRGAAPIQWSIMDGAPKGLSIIDLDRKAYDAGRIYHQEAVDVPLKTDYLTLEGILAERSGRALARVFANWNSAKPCDQKDQITNAPKITLIDAFVDLKRESALSIYLKYLAIGHQENIRARLGDKIVHFLGVQDPDQHADGTSLDRGKGILWIRCEDGKCIGVRHFRVEGKSSTYDAVNFYNNFIQRGSIQPFQISMPP